MNHKRLSRKERTRLTLDTLKEAIPSPQTELIYADAYQLLVAVVLSAQCTDARVNIVTPLFFERFPDVQALAEAATSEIFEIIRSISFPNNKARHLAATARIIADEHGGNIPSDITALMTLPGVGRKSAQVIASVVYDIPALPVDTHVFRVANRIGLIKDADTPLKVEIQLKALIPRDEWGIAHHLFILHGRYTCTARNPKCPICPVSAWCRFYQEGHVAGGPSDFRVK